jgi:hypothetical protein
VVFWSAFCVILAEMGALWVPFGRLLVTFWRFVGFCWIALTLTPKPTFSGFGGPESALMRSLFQVWIQGVFFIGFNVVFCDLGVIWAPFWLPLGLLFRVVFRLCSG